MAYINEQTDRFINAAGGRGGDIAETVRRNDRAGWTTTGVISCRTDKGTAGKDGRLVSKMCEDEGLVQSRFNNATGTPPMRGNKKCVPWTACTPDVPYARAKGGRIHNAAVSPWPPEYKNATGRRRVTVGPSGRVRTNAFGIDYGGEGVMRNASGCNAQYSNQVGTLQATSQSSFANRMNSLRCGGLQSRRNVLADKLNTLSRQGSNPQWQSQLRYKINAIDNEMNRKRC